MKDLIRWPVLIGAFWLALSACGDIDDSPGGVQQTSPNPIVINDRYLSEHQVELSDGTTVTCVIQRNRSLDLGGVSCDWLNRS